MDQGFSEEKRNENEKVRRSNRLGPLDHLPFPFPFHFPSPNTWSKHCLKEKNSWYSNFDETRKDVLEKEDFTHNTNSPRQAKHGITCKLHNEFIIEHGHKIDNACVGSLFNQK